ncbi:insulinase family protein [Balneolaceae bacterium YR4-1]|uniref:Insulinase family protein n=1 Tax=Halalkalibaculum roseum TaxID=2709311 RepID=A0A6M1SYZ3_9BACT|nr:pitrilysin family protein [Halalkalibaculum roseum]NGP75787.1 insulinase family protein [Halalkalibaculum roseum]
MKRFSLICMLVLFVASITQAQKRYDQLKFPELNQFNQPDVEIFTLDNGIKFFLVEDRELPLIDVSVMVRTGGVLVPNEKTGLSSITGTVMRSGGSENYPSDSLNALLENKAASMETGIGFTSGGAGMNVLKEDFDELLPVFIDLLTNPAFPEDKIELAKTQTKSGISRRNDNAQQIGYRVFDQLIYGENSVYARNTEYETVNNISREDLVNFHKEHFVGQNMSIGLVGDFDSDAMKSKLQEAFASIPSGAGTELEFPEVDYEYTSTINFINKSDVNQSFVLLGHLGGMRDNPDYAELQVMNQVLSGGFSGRLFQVVRTDMGLAYSVFGQYGMNTFYPGTFYAGVMTKSATTAEAIDAIIGEIERLQNEPITQEELQDTKDQFLNSLVFRYDSFEKVLNQRMSYDYRGLSENAFDEYVEGVKATTIEDVQRVAREYLNPDQMEILVVGNKDEIGDQLQKYGEVNEIDISIPQPGSEQKVVEGDAEKGATLLDKMSEALVSPGTELNSITLEGEVVQFGEQLPGGQMSLQTTSTIDYPDAVEQTVQTPGGTMKITYADGQGKMSMGGQERPLPPQMNQNLKETLNRSYLAIAMAENDINPQYTGTEEFEDKTYAKLSVNVDDKDILFLVDEETGYPRLMRYQQFNPQQGEQVQIEERYSDWKTVDGVAYAYTQISFSGDQKASETTYKEHKVNQ